MKFLNLVITMILEKIGYGIMKIPAKPEYDDPDYQKLSDVPGFLSFHAFKLFRQLGAISESNKSAKNLKVLEIGIYCGKSLLGLSLIFPRSRIIGVDPFYKSFAKSPAYPEEADYLKAHARNVDGNKRLENLMEKCTQLGVKNRVKIERMTQGKFLMMNRKKEKYRFVYLDGEHSYGATRQFLDKIDSILPDNGFLIVDDLLSFGYPGISEAVHRHPSYKTSLSPIFYGFNKGVFIYQPTEKYLKSVLSGLRKFISRNKYTFHRGDNDDSFVVLE